MKPTTQPYNDGLLTISGKSNTAEPGEMPVEGLVTKHEGIPFEERTVGMTRFWSGMQEDVRIARLLRCPRLGDVHALDVVTTHDGQTYQIEQVQYPVTIEPPSMDLSLSVIMTGDELPAAAAAVPEEPEEGEEDDS